MSTVRSSRRRPLHLLSLLVVGASSFAACTIDLTGVPGGAGGATSATSSGTTAPVCALNEVRPCYTGAAGTQGQSLCKGGQETCNLDGSDFGDCVGEIIPTAEDDCENNIDTTCDGMLVCPCTPGTMMPCYDGPDGTEGKGICLPGIRTCQPDGMSYGVCAGEVTPKAEDCATPTDDNCNGLAYDDMVAGCVCEPKKATGCETALQGPCKPGTQICLDTGKGLGPCVPIVKPDFDDCFSPVDEDCDGTPITCTGTSVVAGAPGTTTGGDSIFAAATDAAGNIFLGGVSDGTNDSNYDLNTGSADIIKLDKSGAQVWKQTYPAMGGSSYSVVRGVTVDKAGDIIVVGEYRGGIDTNGVTLTSTTNSIDIFVIKLNQSGVAQWSKTFGAAGKQVGTSISADAVGNVFITGSMSGMMAVGTDMLSSNDNNDDDLFVAKLDAAGNAKWGKNFGDGSKQTGWHVVATGANVVVTGAFEGSINFTSNLQSAGNTDIFLAQLDANNGKPLWGKRFGDYAEQAGYGVAADSNGNIVLTGSVEGTTNFGQGNLDVGLGKPSDLFVARFKADGTCEWSTLFGDPNGTQVGRDVALDAAGNILVTGHFTGGLQFGTTAFTNPAGNGGTWDVFVAKLKPDGTPGWARSFGDVNMQMARAITADPFGNVIFGGTFNGTINFAPPAALSFSNLNNTYDAFWAKLAP